jgi:hypothetical protein
MVIYLFRDKSNDEFFAFSTDVTGRNFYRRNGAQHPARSSQHRVDVYRSAQHVEVPRTRGTSATSSTCWTTCAPMASTCSKASSLKRRLWGKRRRQASCVTKPPPSAVAETADWPIPLRQAARTAAAPGSHLLLLVAAVCFPSVIW